MSVVPRIAFAAALSFAAEQIVISQVQPSLTSKSWPQFRGEGRDGTASGIPPARLKLDLVWEYPLTSSGVGGIAATDELVVVSSRDLNDVSDVFYILDPADGGLIYKHEYAATGRLDYGNSPRATPVAHLLATVDKDLVALDPNDGLRVVDTFRHKSLDSYAVVMSEQNRALVCCTDGTVILLRLEDKHWRLIGEAQPKRNAAPVLAQPVLADGKLYLRGDRSVYCYRFLDANAE